MQRYSHDFLRRVEVALAASRMKPTDFGREAVADPGFVTQLRRGRSPSLATADKVLAFIDRLDADRANRRPQQDAR